MTLNSTWSCRGLKKKLESWKFSYFFEKFIACFVGDEKLVKNLNLPPDEDVFLKFAECTNIGHLLYIELKKYIRQ